MISALPLDGYVSFWARWQSNAPAVETESGSLSWGQLDSRANRLRAALSPFGVGVGAIVGVLMANGPEYIQAAVAVLKLGAAVSPLNPRYTASELRLVAEKGRFTAIITDAAFVDRLAGSTTFCPILEYERLVRSEASARDVASSTGEHVAVVAYTSGTTGQPKGVVLTHANIVAAAYQRVLCEGQQPASRVFLPTALGYTGGLVVSFLQLTLLRGGCLVLHDHFDAEACLRAIQERRINYLNLASPIVEILARSPSFAATDLSSLKSVAIGGASIALAALEAWNVRGVPLCQSYGQTETAGGVTFLPADYAVAKLGSSGVALPFSQVRIGDGAAPDEIGEIVVRSPAVMRGYHDNDKETAAVLQDGWLRTGDHGRLDADGFLTVVGRIKQMIISGGLNIYPAEIEKVIGAVAGVTEVAVVGVADDRWGEVPLALTYCSSPEPLDRDAIVANIKTHLADYKRPKYLVLGHQPLPRNAAGKIALTEIKDRYGSAGSTMQKIRYTS